MSNERPAAKVIPWENTKFWWIEFYVRDNEASERKGRDVWKRLRRSSGKTDKAEAEALAKAIDRRIDLELKKGPDSGPLTFKRFAEEKWIAGRKHLATWKEDLSRLQHIYPLPTTSPIGDMPIEKVEYEHLRDAFSVLKARIGPEKHQSSARQVLHIYGATRQVFKLALKMKVVPASPCILDKEELPTKRDKVPGRKALLRYSPEELSMLCFDERIPLRRRLLYAMAFFFGARINEVTPRRFRDIDYSFKPMAKVTIATGWRIKAGQLAGTKTEVTKTVPLHPMLAGLLAEWRLSGWREAYGRGPSEDDLILPSPRNPTKVMSSNASLRTLKRDLKMLGLFAEREQHSFRRSFITLFENATPEKGDPLIFMRWTHAKPKDEHHFAEMLATYGNTFWQTQCREMTKLVIPRRTEAEVVQLPVVAVAGAVIASSQQPQGVEMITTKSESGGNRSLIPATHRASSGDVRRLDSSEVCAQSVTKRHQATRTYDGAGIARNHSGIHVSADVLEVLRELLDEHRRDAHHADLCPLCIKAEAALKRAGGDA